MAEFLFSILLILKFCIEKNQLRILITLKRSGDPGPEGDGTTPEGTLTLVSNLLLVVVSIGLDILGNLTELNNTK